MKKIILAFILLQPSFVFAITCKQVSQVYDSKRFDCVAETDTQAKTFHILNLKGKFSQISFDQGYLMADESQRGIIQEVLLRMNKDLLSGGTFARNFKQMLANCMRDRMYRSIDAEFLSGIEQFYWGLNYGMKAQGKELPQSYNDILMASLGIELSIAFEGLQRRREENPLGIFAEVTAMCGINASLENLQSFMEVLPELRMDLKMGCLGFISPAENNRDGALLHARNFDANMVDSWNIAPTLFLIEEPGFYKYAATSAAGAIFPGGVSGFNEKGIAVSLHEMSTTHYKTATNKNRGMMAPFLQQRILRETSSVNQAVRLIQSVQHFGAWTFLISDSKTNESVSVEVSADRVQVAKREYSAPMGQSNHFVGSLMQDQAFTYNFNKRLESESRLQVIDAALKRDAGKIDVDWAIDQLSGHEDAFEGFRSFGRTATKAYTVMSTIAVPNRQEFWMTIGERRPASHSTFIGFHIDFANSTATPFGQKRVSRFQAIQNWENSLAAYSESRIQYEKDNKQQTVVDLTTAIDLAKKDGIDELPYYFMRARVQHELKNFDLASKDFEFLMQRRNDLHPYQQALVLMYSVAASQKLSASGQDVRLTLAEKILRDLQSQYHHFDLDKKLAVLKKLRSATTTVELPILDFVTVE
ncbi:MAG: hypothetical protein J0L93_09280 [Deltaproteobacteria bacterium]|nr:hypothetical protein [Deltaproteobacteria bacterium]